MNINEIFDKWYDSEGVRFYSKNHGNAEGHYDYMKKAYLDGFFTGLELTKTIIELNSADDKIEIQNN